MRRFWLPLGVALLLAPPAAGQPAPPDSVWWSMIDELPPGVSVLALDSLYGMVATDERGVGLQLGLFGPEIAGETFHGSHRADWRYRYDWARDARGRCRLSEVTILLRSVIHMPHLVNVDQVDDRLRETWKSYAANLRTHEEGHREITRTALVGLRERMLEAPFLECEAFLESLQPLKDDMLAELRARQVAYDEETGHGRTQGATWPPR